MTPFKQGKFEHSGSHLYHLDQSLAVDLESPHPLVLIGSRGSGKTTLLKALDHEERRSNTSLQAQLGNDTFRGWFIGRYTKLSQHPCRALESLYGAGTPIEGRIFGLYMDALFVRLIAESVSGLVSDGVMQASPERSEADVASECFSSFPDVLSWIGRDVPCTLLEVAKAALQIMHRLQQTAECQRTPLEISSQIRIPGFGEFSRGVSRVLADFCDAASLRNITTENIVTRPKNVNWHFKVCIDEAESVTEQHIRVLNTITRLSEFPLFPVFSFVGQPIDLSATLIPNITQQSADVRKVLLDDSDDDTFKRRAEGVATVRCRAALSDESIEFQSSITLGHCNLDSLIDGIVRTSEGKESAELLKSAQNFIEKWGQSDSDDTSPSPLPFIDAYIAKHDRLEPPDPTAVKGARKQSSETFRKKRVVAFLAICDELGCHDIPFAFDRMVLGVSDHCIRDFLSQMHYMFSEFSPVFTGESLRAFVSGPIAIPIQTKATRQASTIKRDSLPISGVDRPDMTRKIVEVFGRTTHILQSKMSEAGRFVLVGGSNNDREDARRVLRSAAEAGFLRIVDDGAPPDPLRGFRVHTSLAPTYGFSYRGAYYPVSVKFADYSEIISCDVPRRYESLAKRIADRAGTTGSTGPLLFPEDDEASTQ